MASIKTIVRELGVIYWTDRILNEEIIDPEEVTPDEFYNRCSNIIGPEIEEANKIQGRDSFRSNKVQILENTYWLSKRLIQNLGIDEIEQAEWIGPDTQSEVPVDIILNGERISLKEDSYILENMGLYKLINLLTHSDYKQNSWHIFQDFAPEKFEEWFKLSWNFLLQEAEETGEVWQDQSKDYDRKLVAEDEVIRFIYKNREIEVPKEEISYEYYYDETIGDVREIFGKWLVDQYLEEEADKEDKEAYYNLKKDCAKTAGGNLKKYLEENLNIKYDNLLRMLQVYEKDYYYAKAAGGKAQIFYVPSIENYERENLVIDNFEPSVPDSQLNFITTIENKEDGDKLKLRNEIRFSHRQFNGSPEAKMYIVENYDLSPVYRELDVYDYTNDDVGTSLTDFV